MKTRLFIVFVIVSGLVLALAGVVIAQGAKPPATSERQLVAWEWDEDRPFSQRPVLARDVVAQGVSAPDVALGRPGLSFRYVQAFGQTGVPYSEDTNHLNFPYALATDGNNVWIGEAYGHRTLKFTSDGAYVAQIGKVGINNYSKETVRRISDVAVDGNGNIWVADIDAAHVLKYGPDLKYVSELGKIWNHGSGNDQFDQPTGLAFDAVGNIYISDGAPEWNYDYGNHRIQVFDKSGNYLTTIGQTGMAGSGNNQLHGPRHIAIFGDRLYITDSGNHRVQIFNISNPASPSYAGTIGVTGTSGGDNIHFNNPSGVAVDTNYIYVADRWNNRVQIFNCSAPFGYQGTIAGAWGPGNNQFKNPTDVAVDAAGNIYVADYWNERVQQFNAARAYVRTYGTTGVPYLTDRTHFNEPQGVAVARDGSIYVVEEYGHRLIKLDAAGVPLWSVGEPGMPGGWNSENDHLNWPASAAVDEAGRVYVADRYNNRIQIFDSSGAYYATLGGQWGIGNDQFAGPQGLAFGPNGNLYVADADNHRVQIFNRSLVYIATLGVAGVSGSDNAHFNWPVGVAVDSAGLIYVADANNLRVQVFGPDRSYLRTIGQTGISGDDFSHFKNPIALAVDASRNVYVGDGWATRIHVYDSSGAYLTTFGASWGSRTGQTEHVQGLAVGPDGAIYVADSWDNYRITKFAPGVLGWRQVNINGFGQQPNRINSLAPFGGQLYAGAYNYSGNGAQLWRMDTAGNWTPMITNGFGITRNVGIDHLAEFNGQLYAGIWADSVNGGEVWRSSDGQNWTRVASRGFGDPTNGEVFHLAVFSNTLYATTWSYTNTHGTEIWRSSDGQNWAQAVSNGLGDATNTVGLTMEVFNGALYAGIRSIGNTGPTGCEVWRTVDGLTWTKVITDGFGNMGCYDVSSLASFQGYLYAGTGVWDASTRSYPGGEVWCCSADSGCDEAIDWTRVVTKGFNNPNNINIEALIEFGSHLYAVAYNFTTGMEVWRSADGIHWEQVSVGGFGDSNNAGPYWGHSVAVYNSRLYIGTTNSANGGEIWGKTLTADFTASPTRGAPPLTVQFANSSAGDFTSSQWDFGDGATSTAVSPTHTYTAAGTYTVTLMVGDGTDTSTLTKPAYIQASKYIFLPLVMRSYGPVLYDDFNNPAYDGSYDHARWAFSGNSAFTAQQQAGALVFTNATMSAADGADLVIQQPARRSLRQLQQFEARLRVSHDHAGRYAFVKIQISGDVAGHSWWTQCRLGVWSGDTQTNFICDAATYDSDGAHFEYETQAVTGAFDTWYTARIEADPSTANLRFYLDGSLVGSYTPKDAAALRVNGNLRSQVGVWNDDANTYGTRYIDDVRITPAQ